MGTFPDYFFITNSDNTGLEKLVFTKYFSVETFQKAERPSLNLNGQQTFPLLNRVDDKHCLEISL
jgi:hypothetical protein